MWLGVEMGEEISVLQGSFPAECDELGINEHVAQGFAIDDAFET